MSDEMMKLSAAMRAGAKLRPQAGGSFFEVERTKQASCALGAAYEALWPKNTALILEWLASDDKVGLVKPRRTLYNGIPRKLIRAYPALESVTFCPDCGLGEAYGRIVEHLNDTHNWSRERIADWLEGQGL